MQLSFLQLKLESDENVLNSKGILKSQHYLGSTRPNGCNISGDVGTKTVTLNECRAELKCLHRVFSL